MKIGILGGGQLARMIIESCSRYDFEFHILTAEKDSPAGRITRYVTVADWNDDDSLIRFAAPCDVITLENEFIDSCRLALLEKSGKKVLPGSGIIKLVQDKLFQKETLKMNGIPVAEFRAVDSVGDITEFAAAHGYPVILKSRTMGYDGKGNRTISSARDAEDAFTDLSLRGKLMCEKFVKFEKELAVQAVRNTKGETVIYPVVESIQKDHICNIVIAARNAFSETRSETELLAGKILDALDYAGVLAIEMFLGKDGLLVNELAPRVHNTGHYTIEGCYTSQFENHVRAILGFAPGSAEMREDFCVMANILGERDGPAELKNAASVLAEEKVYLHLYGKSQTKIGRKMGHITALGADRESVLKKAEECRSKISI